MFEPETDSEEEEEGERLYRVIYKSMYQNVNEFYVSLSTTSDT